MANTIKIKNSGTSANVPSAASLEYGELALNYADGKLYFKTGASTVDFLKSNITLGTDTTGNYMSNVAAGTGISVSHTPAEGSTATVSLASGYGDTLNPYASKTANFVLSAPNGSAGVPTFRAIVAADIPTLNQNTTGTAATVTGASQTAITSVGTLTGLTIGGAGANRSITINAPSGYYAIQYFAINGTNEWHYEVAPAGTRWSLVESGVAERIGVTSTGATFSGTVTATTFSGSGASLTSLPAGQLTDTIASARISGSYTGITGVGTLSSGSIPSSLLSGQTGMWSSANRPGPYRLYRRDSDDPYNVQTYWTGARWRLYGYYNDSSHADTHVGYADSAGSASTAGYASTVGSGSGGIPYPGATVGGGSPNNIGFRWTNPFVNCTVDNVISAACANFSDRRLKTNIQTLTNGMDLIRSLRCVTYNPLDVIGFEEETLEPIIGDLDPYDEMIGFIADEVQEVYANAIHGEGNRMKSIDTVQLLSMAVSAIQDLDARLQQLETV